MTNDNDRCNVRSKRSNPKKRWIVFALLAAMAGLSMLSVLLTGCDEAEYLQVCYYTPNWLPDGRIIANADYWYSKKADLWHTVEYTTRRTNWVVVMDADGKNEQKLFRTDTTTPMVISPDGQKLTYGYQILDFTGKVLAEVPTVSITITPEIAKRFDEKQEGNYTRPFWFNPTDWSPDGTKLVGEYLLGTVYYYDLTTKQVHYVTEGYEPAWLDEEKIMCADVDKKIRKKMLYIYNTNKKKRQETSIGEIGWPKRFKENVIFAYAGDDKKDGYGFIDLKTEKTLDVFQKHEKGYKQAHLSPDGTKVIACEVDGKGIYITDLRGEKTTVLKTADYIDKGMVKE